MKCLTTILKALVLTGVSFYTSDALGPTDVAQCCLHPDPHFISFHGIPYDYQHGCDVVLVDNPNIKIHARLVKYMFTSGTGFSYIDGIGIQIGTDTLEVRTGGTYYINDPYLTTPNSLLPTPTPPVATIGGQPFSISPTPSGGGYQYKIELPNVVTYPSGAFNILIDDYSFLSTGSDRDFGVSMCINGHGSYFLNSVGMCGTWNEFTGLHSRAGVNMIPLFPPTSFIYDASIFGDNWQVQPIDGPFMSGYALPIPAGAFPPGGHEVWPDTCMARRYLAEDETNGRLEVAAEQDTNEVPNTEAGTSTALALAENQDNRELSSGCYFCETMTNPIARANCEYDASVLDCNTVQDFFKPFYNEKTMYYKKEMKPIPCAVSYPKKWRRTKCSKKGGECVRFCDTKNPKVKCILGLCDQKFPYQVYKKGGPVLLYDRYYSDCSCMLKKKKKHSDAISDGSEDETIVKFP